MPGFGRIAVTTAVIIVAVVVPDCRHRRYHCRYRRCRSVLVVAIDVPVVIIVVYILIVIVVVPVVIVIVDILIVVVVVPVIVVFVVRFVVIVPLSLSSLSLAFSLSFSSLSLTFSLSLSSLSLSAGSLPLSNSSPFDTAVIVEIFLIVGDAVFVRIGFGGLVWTTNSWLLVKTSWSWSSFAVKDAVAVGVRIETLGFRHKFLRVQQIVVVGIFISVENPISVRVRDASIGPAVFFLTVLEPVLIRDLS